MIRSSSNQHIKLIKSLKQKKYREKQGLYITEGLRSVDEALLYPDQIENIYISQSFDKSMLKSKLEPIVIEDRLFRSISNTKASQGILAIARIIRQDISTIKSGSFILSDGIQDPGNLGTIIRSIDALGFDGLILGPKTVDPYNDKVIRSTMGSIHRVGIYYIEDLKQIKDLGLKIYAAVISDEALPIYEARLEEDMVLVLGNEGGGISQEMKEIADQTVYIPMNPQTESLNVSISAGIIMYEARRQRWK